MTDVCYGNMNRAEHEWEDFTEEHRKADEFCPWCNAVRKKDYPCKGCRDFADNFTPRDYPTPEEPYHPDCPYHKEK